MITNSDKLLVNLFANGHSHNGDQKEFEKTLGDKVSLKHFYQEKVQEREFIKELVPEFTLSKRSYKNLLDEINQINKSIFEFKEDNFIKKSIKFLDKPIFTIEF